MNDLWDLLQHNDVYAVGAMFYRLLGLSIDDAFNGGVIPTLPKHYYSSECNALFRSLVNTGPSLRHRRITAKEAVVKLQYLLWGRPPTEVHTTYVNNSPLTPVETVSWWFQRRLDLVFNVGQTEKKFLKMGTLNTMVPWPPSCANELDLARR